MVVERKQPLGLRRRVLIVRDDEVVVAGAAAVDVGDVIVQLGVDQLGPDPDAVAGLLLEERDAAVQGLVHRSAH